MIAQVSKTRDAGAGSDRPGLQPRARRLRYRLLRRSGRAVVEPAPDLGDQVRLDDARHDLSYTPSDVFETFPRPTPTDWLDKIGRRLDTERREIMLRRDLGLTKLYNLVNDPDIADASDEDVAKLRAIHVELDRAVMDAYGWTDVPLDHGFHTYRQMQRWTVSPAARVEILDRLLEENHRRAAAQGTTPAPTADDEEADA